VPFERYYLGGDGMQNFSMDGRETIQLRGYPNNSLTPVRTNALNFDGVNDYVNLGNLSTFMGNYTIEAWVNLTPNTHANSIVGKHNSSVVGTFIFERKFLVERR
jgi:hypothetical protein